MLHNEWGLIVRHNRMRDLVDKIAREGRLGPVMEKKGILGESKKPGRRPGDVTLPLWSEGKGLCVDVAVTCPFSVGNLVRDSPADYCATNLKHRNSNPSACFCSSGESRRLRISCSIVPFCCSAVAQSVINRNLI